LGDPSKFALQLSRKDFNEVVGSDLNLISADNRWRAKAFLHKSIFKGADTLSGTTSWTYAGGYVDRHWEISFFHEYVGKNVYALSNPLEVTDSNYMNLFNGEEDIKLRDVCVTGYIQDFDIFGNKHRNIVKQLLTSANTDEIHEGICACHLDISAIQDSFVLRPKDVVIHVRLDDFIHSTWNADILKTDYYEKALGDRDQWDRVVIVTDVLRTPEEKGYITTLKNILGGEVVLHQGTILEDWRLMCRARNIVVSNSTFAWTALIAGNAEFAVIPHTKLYGNQVVVPIKHIPQCTVIDATTTNVYN
jgi:hypothetical protein